MAVGKGGKAGKVDAEEEPKTADDEIVAAAEAVSGEQEQKEDEEEAAADGDAEPDLKEQAAHKTEATAAPEPVAPAKAGKKQDDHLDGLDDDTDDGLALGEWAMNSEPECELEEGEEEDSASAWGRDRDRLQMDGESGGAHGGGKAKGGKAKAQAAKAAKGSRQSSQQSQPARWRCRGCCKLKPDSEYTCGSVYCMHCRSLMDSLSRLSVQQKEGDWWREVRADPKKLATVLKRYDAEAPGVVGRSGRTRRPKWSIATYKETIKSASQVRHVEVGRMLTQKLYFKWAESLEGGLLSEEAAMRKWKEWEELPEDEVHKDRRGPNGELRMRVVTGTEVNFEGLYSVAKELELKGKENKKATADDVQAQRKYLMDGHDRIGGVNTGVHEMGGIAKGMLDAASSSRGAFDLEGAMPVKISRLRSEDDDDDRDAAKEAVESGDASDGKTLGPPVTPKKQRRKSTAKMGEQRQDSDRASVSGASTITATPVPKGGAAYFDYAKAAASAVEAWSLTCDTLRAGYQSVRSGMESDMALFIGDNGGADPAVKDFVKHRVELLQSKQKARPLHSIWCKQRRQHRKGWTMHEGHSVPCCF